MITYLFVKAPGLKVYYQLYMKGSLFSNTIVGIEWPQLHVHVKVNDHLQH